MKISDFNPKVSIVIPVYNGANYLKEAIDSALAQTYKNIEIVVVNDGSTDNGATEKIAKSYGNKIKYYKKENGGVATALNLGIKKMTGEYFSWLSHDDLFAKTKIEHQVKCLKENGQKDVIIACNAKVLFESGIKKKERIDVDTFRFIDIFLSTSANVGVNGCSLLIPKEAFEKCGDFAINLPVTQDYDLWFRMKDKFKFVLLDQHLVISRRHEEQDSVQKKDMLYKAGDELHSKFLSTISYARFEEYFEHNKKNIKHTYENYIIYKSRGYKTTSSMILKNILKYYYDNDKSKFYNIFSTELGTTNVRLHTRRKSNRLAFTQRLKMEHEWNGLLSSGTNNFPIRDETFNNGIKKHTESPKTIKRFIGSVKRDGIYLTGEKAVRKAYNKTKSL